MIWLLCKGLLVPKGSPRGDGGLKLGVSSTRTILVRPVREPARRMSNGLVEMGHETDLEWEAPD